MVVDLCALLYRLYSSYNTRFFLVVLRYPLQGTQEKPCGLNFDLTFVIHTVSLNVKTDSACIIDVDVLRLKILISGTPVLTIHCHRQTRCQKMTCLLCVQNSELCFVRTATLKTLEYLPGVKEQEIIFVRLFQQSI